MNAIYKQREIINRKLLTSNIQVLFEKCEYDPNKRSELLAVLKQALEQGTNEVKQRFLSSGIGNEVITSNSFLMDQLVRILFDFTTSYVYPATSHSVFEKISMVAIGGYGRRELAPFSDIDLMFLIPYKKSSYVEQIIEFILYLLWDLGLKVGHSTRSIDECIWLSKKDYIIQTSLLDARWLWGNQALFNEFSLRYKESVLDKNTKEFVDAKLEERDQRHQRIGDSRYALEPNLKEGKGGLRDLQTLYWLTKRLYGASNINKLEDIKIFTKHDITSFNKSFEFLWTVRCHLHYLTGRAEERLSFDLQESIGSRMHYTDRANARGVERFMKHYFLTVKTVGDLTHLICAILEDQQKKAPFFRILGLSKKPLTVPGLFNDKGRLVVNKPEIFKEDPLKLLSVFSEAQENNLDIHPITLRLVTQSIHLVNESFRSSPETNALFLKIITSRNNPERTLRRLNETGVLGKFIPEFGQIVAQMEFSMYHSFTVDEHTIRAIGILSEIEAGTYSDELPNVTLAMNEIQSRKALYIALFLHDICKGRKGDHSELGADLALNLCPRLGLTEEETETVSWLVKEHLTMSDIAFKRDFDDPKTVKDFVAKVKSVERLKLLTVLTCADIRAVGPKTWNNWKSGLLRGLYIRTLEFISGNLVSENRDDRIALAKSTLQKSLSTWSAPDIERHLSSGDENYWLNYDEPTLLWHAQIVNESAETGIPFNIQTRINKEFNYTEITVYAPDHPGLFSKIAGVMVLSKVNIVDAKISTLSDGMVLDTFAFLDSNNQPTTDEKKIQRIVQGLKKMLSGRLDVQNEIRLEKNRSIKTKSQLFDVASRVLLDNNASSTNTVVEVNGQDRIGLLYEITSALTALQLKISSAHVTTFGSEVVDTFYVKDHFGLKISHPEKQSSIKKELLSVVNTKQATNPIENR